MKKPNVILVGILVSAFFALPAPYVSSTIDPLNRTLSTANLRMTFGTDGAIGLYDRNDDKWRSITPAFYPVGIGRLSLNGTSFLPANDNTLTYLSSSLVNNTVLKLTYRQNLTIAGAGYKNWLLFWDVYARESYEDTIETWTQVYVDNGTINKIGVTYPLIGIGFGNGSDVYLNDKKWTYGWNTFAMYPFGKQIPLYSFVKKSDATALYVFYSDNTEGRINRIEGQTWWGQTAWNLEVDFYIRLVQSAHYETTHIFFYSVFDWAPGYALKSSYIKAVQWYTRYLQPKLPSKPDLERFRSRSTNLFLNPSTSDWKSTLESWFPYISSIFLYGNEYDNTGDLNPVNTTRIREIAALAHCFNLPVGLYIDIVVPTDSQLYLQHNPEYFAVSNRLCAACPSVRTYLYNKMAMWAGLGIDIFFLNNIQFDDSICSNPAHIHDNYLLACNEYSLIRYLMAAINANNTDSVPNFMWGDTGSDNTRDLGTIVVSYPPAWGSTFNDFIVNVTRTLYEVNPTYHNVEPSWLGTAWSDLSIETEYLVALATKILPCWTSHGSDREMNAARNVSVFLMQHETAWQNQPVVVESLYPFMVVKIGNQVKSVIPVNATALYSGALYSESNDIALTYTRVANGVDIMLVNKNRVNAVSTIIHNNEHSFPITLAANEIRLVWNRGDVTVTKVLSGYVSEVYFSGENLTFKTSAITKGSVTMEIYTQKGNATRIYGVTSASYNGLTKILTLVASNATQIDITWQAPSQFPTEVVLAGATTIATGIAIWLWRRKRKNLSQTARNDPKRKFAVYDIHH